MSGQLVLYRIYTLETTPWAVCAYGVNNVALALIQFHAALGLSIYDTKHLYGSFFDAFIPTYFFFFKK